MVERGGDGVSRVFCVPRRRSPGGLGGGALVGRTRAGIRARSSRLQPSSAAAVAAVSAVGPGPSAVDRTADRKFATRLGNIEESFAPP